LLLFADAGACFSTYCLGDAVCLVLDADKQPVDCGPPVEWQLGTAVGVRDGTLTVAHLEYCSPFDAEE